MGSHPGGSTCATHSAPPTHSPRARAGPGTATQPHGHAGVQRSPPARSPALGHHQHPPSPVSVPSPCCFWDLPGGALSPSGPQNPWSWGSAAPMSHRPPQGLPCALLGSQPLPGATSSHQITARRAGHRCAQAAGPVQAEVGADLFLHVPTGGFWPGHMQCQAKPHLPGPWVSPGVLTALQHRPRPGRAGLGWNHVLRGPRALLPRGSWMLALLPSPPRARGDTRRVFCGTSSIASGSRAWGVGVRGG